MVVAAAFTRPPVWFPTLDNRAERFAVIDLIYVLATFAFFALMVAYVRACQHLGRAPSNDDKSAGEIS